jgi:hypothetical protein
MSFVAPINNIYSSNSFVLSCICTNSSLVQEMLERYSIFKQLIFNGFYCLLFIIFEQMIDDEIREKLQNIVKGSLPPGAGRSLHNDQKSP